MLGFSFHSHRRTLNTVQVRATRAEKQLVVVAAARANAEAALRTLQVKAQAMETEIETLKRKCDADIADNGPFPLAELFECNDNDDENQAVLTSPVKVLGASRMSLSNTAPRNRQLQFVL